MGSWESGYPRSDYYSAPIMINHITNLTKSPYSSEHEHVELRGEAYGLRLDEGNARRRQSIDGYLSKRKEEKKKNLGEI